MARQKVLHKPYVIEREKKTNQKKELDKFQLAFLKAIESLEEPTKPVKWWKPIKESFKPVEEQKDASVARFAFMLNPALRLHVNKALTKKEGKYTDVIEMLKSKDEKDYISGLDEIRT